MARARRGRLPAIAGLAILVVVGCGATASTGPDGDQTHVSTASGTVTVTLDQAADQLTLVSTAAGRSAVSTGVVVAPGEPLVHFSSFAWSDAAVDEMYVYGMAPSGAVTFTIQPGGDVAIGSNGTFLVVVPGGSERMPTAYQWRFTSSSGQVLLQGSGGYPVVY